MMVPPADTAAVLLRNASMKASASRSTGVKASVFRNLQALQAGGQSGNVSFDIVGRLWGGYIGLLL